MRGLGGKRAATSKWKAALRQTIVRHKAADAAGKLRAKKASGALQRVAAYHAGCALDHQLIMTGSGLSRFRKKGVVRLLSATERRYTCPCKRPHPFPIPAGIVPKRACVEDCATKKTRFELTWGDLGHHPVASIVADEGPRDKPMWVWMSSMLRMLEQMDPLHRIPRDLYLAAMDCKCWQMILDTTAVFNFDHAPYLTEENFRKATEAITAYALHAGPDDELLLDSFEELCHSVGDTPPDFGSKDHIDRVIRGLPYMQAFKSMTSKVKWTRWKSHYDAAESFLPLLPCKKFALKVQNFLGGDALPTERVSVPAFVVQSSYMSYRWFQHQHLRVQLSVQGFRQVVLDEVMKVSIKLYKGFHQVLLEEVSVKSFWSWSMDLGFEMGKLVGDTG